MDTIRQGMIVSVRYQVKNSSGQVVDGTVGDDVFSFVQGSGEIVRGLESALDGRKVGETFEVSVPPELAYGQRDPDEVIRVPRAALPPDVACGAQLVVEGPDGRQAVIWVTSIDGEEATVDGNHPMAGETLTFRVEVVGVMDPSTVK